ncbi:hypothetical protein ACIPUP_21365, partial [Pectobacterium actinidiae]
MSEEWKLNLQYKIYRSMEKHAPKIVYNPTDTYCQLGETSQELSWDVLLCPENPQLGWGFSKAFSFEPVIKTPFDLLK